MRSSTSASPARRTRRRTATIAAGLVVGVLATAGVTATATASATPPSASASISHFALASFSVAQPVVPGAAGSADPVSVRAREALEKADAALTAVESVTADIAASGLDVGTTDTSVDTSALGTAVARLAAARGVPTPLVPQLTADLEDLVAPVSVEASTLRGRLDAAVQLKAEQEAAAKAQREAEEAAAAAAAAAQAAEEAAAAQAAASAPSSSSSTAAAPSTPNYAAASTSAGEAQSIARGMLAGYGWGDDQFSCLVSLWNRESGWNTRAANPSGAYGIPQALPGSKMASAGADWQTSASTQIAWGFGYISGRYGTPCGAWSHSESVGWY